MRSTARAQTVAVVGGGFTGLSGAHQLAKAGYQVDLFEASPSVGGLASGFALDDGFPLERAYHFLYTTDRYMLAVADELGVADRLHFYPSSIVAFVDGVPYPFTTATDLLRFTPLSLVDRIRTGLTGLRLMMTRDVRRLSAETAYSWLCRVNGRRATDLVWKPLLIGKFDAAWDSISMAWLWARIRVRQTSRLRGTRAEHLGYFDGGFGIMVERWLQELRRHGASVHTATSITAMGERDGRPVLTVGPEERAYDAVLVTVPSPVFARVAGLHPQMTARYAEQLESVVYLDALLMIVATDRPITDTYWHQIHDPDAPFLVVVSLDSLIGVEATGGRHIYFIGDYVANGDPRLGLSDDELRASWFESMRALFPAFDETIVRESHVFRFHHAQHVVDVGYEDRIPAVRTPMDGYFLANFAQVFPEDRGTNYAVREGIAAARLISDHLRANHEG